MTESFLHEIPLFASLEKGEIEQLSGIMMELQLPADTSLFVEGDKGDCLYIVSEGELEVVKQMNTPDQQVLRILRQHDYFGEMSFYNPSERRSATVRSRTPVRLLELKREAFAHLVDAQPHIIDTLMRDLASRFYDSERRLMHALRQKNLQIKEQCKALLEREYLTAIGKALSSLAHELKPPLAAIGGFIRLASRHVEDGSADHAKLELVLKETERLESLIGDVLDISRPLEQAQLVGNIEDLFKLLNGGTAMPGDDGLPPMSRLQVRLLTLSERAVSAQSIEQLANDMLREIAGLFQSNQALLYVAAPGIAEPFLFSYGSHPGLTHPANLKNLCLEYLPKGVATTDYNPISLPSPAAQEIGVHLLFPLQDQRGLSGLVGLAPKAAPDPSLLELFNWFLQVLKSALLRLVEKEKAGRQLKHLQTYMTISSMLCQPLGLLELLENILYACLDVASAEEASVLVLDDDKKNFRFYQVEGPSKPVLIGATFPADKGIAGAALRTQQSEVINDVQNDPRFYGKIDSDTGFQTRSMIVVPLSAGEERIGVIEVLNKVNGGHFTDDEHLFLLSIAEEVAFAIRNAKVFEYVVNSYCKQRQGQNSCKGCKRPLGSWTPCVKYRETAL